MAKPRFLILAAIVLGMTFVAGTVVPADLSAQEVPRISVDQVKAMLGKPGMVVIDVRTARDWNSSHEKIRGAVRHDPVKVATWADQYQKTTTLVLYCS